jgi:triosephosphate isomerase
MDRLLMINMKAYEQGIGRKARYIADIASRLSSQTGVKIILVAQPTDIESLSFKNNVFAQHIDPVSYGSQTGHILPEAVRTAGAKGSLINHFERSLSMDEIKQRIDRAKNVGLTTVACARTPEDAAKIAAMGPDYIAIEPQELIGNPISKNNPGFIQDAVSAVRSANPSVKVLAGAGINSSQDVVAALSLGAVGVIVSSAVVKSENPEQSLKDILSGF